MTSLKTLGSIDGYVDAMLGRRPQAREQSQQLDGENYQQYATAYYAAYRAARGDSQ